VLAAGFCDRQHTLELVLPIADDRVFVRWRMTGRHTGPFLGIPATERVVDFYGHDLLRVADGQIAEVWHIEQLLQLTQQLTAETSAA